MKEDTKRWFKPKKYGWGWTPDAWQGWAATAGYGLFVGVLTYAYSDLVNSGEFNGKSSGVFLMVLYFGALLAGMLSLVLVGYLKGGSPSNKGANYFKK